MPRRSGRRGKAYIELEGVDELRKAFAQLRGGALENARRQVVESAEAILAGAQARVPERKEQLERDPAPGETRKSFNIRYRDFGLSATVGSTYYIARFRELGTSKQMARPALFPAFEQERPNYLAGLESALNRAGRDAEVA